MGRGEEEYFMQRLPLRYTPLFIAYNTGAGGTNCVSFDFGKSVHCARYLSNRYPLKTVKFSIVRSPTKSSTVIGLSQFVLGINAEKIGEPYMKH
jgi:hypothetical protein